MVSQSAVSLGASVCGVAVVRLPLLQSAKIEKKVRSFSFCGVENVKDGGNKLSD